MSLKVRLVCLSITERNEHLHVCQTAVPTLPTSQKHEIKHEMSVASQYLVGGRSSRSRRRSVEFRASEERPDEARDDASAGRVRWRVWRAGWPFALRWRPSGSSRRRRSSRSGTDSLWTAPCRPANSCSRVSAGSPSDTHRTEHVTFYFVLFSQGDVNRKCLERIILG